MVVPSGWKIIGSTSSAAIRDCWRGFFRVVEKGGFIKTQAPFPKAEEIGILKSSIPSPELDLENIHDYEYIISDNYIMKAINLESRRPFHKNMNF